MANKEEEGKQSEVALELQMIEKMIKEMIEKMERHQEATDRRQEATDRRLDEALRSFRDALLSTSRHLDEAAPEDAAQPTDDPSAEAEPGPCPSSDNDSNTESPASFEKILNKIFAQLLKDDISSLSEKFEAAIISEVTQLNPASGAFISYLCKLIFGIYAKRRAEEDKSSDSNEDGRTHISDLITALEKVLKDFESRPDTECRVPMNRSSALRFDVFSGTFVSEKKSLGKLFRASFEPDVASVLKDLSKKSERVAKVAPSRICSLAIHPRADTLFLATGAQCGKFGLWNVIDAMSDIHRLKVHDKAVNCLTFCPFNTNHLISASYDGRVCQFDLQAQKAETLFHGNYPINYHQQIGRHTFLVSLGLPGIGILDTREHTSKCPRVFKIFAKHGAEMVDLHPDACKFVCPNLIGECGIWDIRNGKENSDGVVIPLTRLTGHERSPITSASFSPMSGKSVVTVSNDDHIRLFDVLDGQDAEVQPRLTWEHNNQTGNWRTPFKARWHPKRDDLFFIGSKEESRLIEAFSDQGLLYGTLSGKSQSCGIVDCHPIQDVVAGANFSGKVFLFM